MSTDGMPVTDEMLLNNIADGDRDAFAAFYDRQAPRVFALLLNITRSRTEAEDALQETFAQVWASARRYDASRGAPLSWLLQIARSRGIDTLRKRDDAPQVQDRHAVAAPTGDALESRELVDRTDAALRRLSDRERQLIRLAFFDGLTHQEIARQQGMALGTVKSHIRRGMQQMRTLLRVSADRGAL